MDLLQFGTFIQIAVISRLKIENQIAKMALIVLL